MLHDVIDLLQFEMQIRKVMDQRQLTQRGQAIAQAEHTQHIPMFSVFVDFRLAPLSRRVCRCDTQILNCYDIVSATG